jgi:hypothetical protein
MDIDAGVGKRWHLVYTDGQDGRPMPDTTKTYSRDADLEKYPDKLVPTQLWVVKSIEGMGGTATSAKSAQQVALELIVGKTRAEFNAEAFKNTAIKSDVTFQRSITDKSFIEAMLGAAVIVEDENKVFQVGPNYEEALAG